MCVCGSVQEIRYAYLSLPMDTGSPKLKPAFQGDVICLHAFFQTVIVCVRYQLLKIFSRGEAKSIQISLPSQSQNYTSFSSLLSNQPPC